MQSYEDLRPFIARAVSGESNVLCPLPIDSITTTSGTTGEPKIIPQYKGMQRTEFLQSIVSTLDIVRKKVPGSLCTPLAVIVAGREADRISTHVPHAASANETYRRNLFRHLLAIPPVVFNIRNSEAKYYYCNLFTMGCRCAVLLTPNPTTIAQMLTIRDEHAPALHNDLCTTTLINRFDLATEVFAELAGEWQAITSGVRRHSPENVTHALGWGHLRAIVCWRAGSAGYHAEQVIQRLGPKVQVIDLGYLASDSPLLISAPGIDGQLLMGMHVYAEFQDVASPDSPLRLYHELQLHREYVAIVTNSYGLYRYDTQDIFRVVGRAGRAPTLQFVRKRDGFSNLTGEKLAEGQVIASVRHAIATLGIDTGFFIAIPSVAELRYHFYLEMTAPQSVDRDTLARTIDEALGNINTEYRDKRASGRLACPCAHALKPGAYGLVKQALVDGGAREAQFKLLFLQPDERLKSRFDALTWLATRALPDDGTQREFADQPVLLPLS